MFVLICVYVLMHVCMGEGGQNAKEGTKGHLQTIGRGVPSLKSHPDIGMPLCLYAYSGMYVCMDVCNRKINLCV